jgi:hypothetical protein
MALCILVTVYGFFVGPGIPTAYAWANLYIEVTSAAQMCFHIGAAILDTLIILYIGISYDAYGPDVFWNLLLALSIALLFLISVIMQLLGSVMGDRFSKPDLSHN